VPAVLFYTFPTACRSELCQRSLKIKKRPENRKNVKNVTKNKKKTQKRFFYIYGFGDVTSRWELARI